MKKLLIVLIAAVLITMFMPYGGLRSINLTLGQTWDRETITAPFDIPIHKTQDEIDQEKNSLGSNNKPVFVPDAALNSKVKSQLTTAAIKANLTDAEKQNIGKVVDEIYSVGVISQDNFKAYATKTVYIKDADESLRTAYAGSLYTPMSALDIIVSKTKLRPELAKAYVDANLRYDSQLSKMLENDAISNISITKGVVPRGETLVSNGQVIDQSTLLLIDSYNKALVTNAMKDWVVYLMYALRFIIVLGVLVLNVMFFTRFSTTYFELTLPRLAFVLMHYVLICGLLGLVARFPFISAYVVPLPVVAIYVLTFFNMRVAVLVNISVALLGALFVSSPFEFLFISIIGGMVGIFMMHHLYHRGKLFRALGVIVLTQIVLFLIFSLLFSGDILQADYTPILWMIISCMLFLGLYQLVYLQEKIFGFVSDATLLELCDTNQPLLLKLAQTAPGTFQHSVQVSNLAESAAKAIGANPLKARVGGLYHDIGKIANPFYFVENLSGDFNPHNDCVPSRSVEIIRQHVTDGLELARKYSLPAVVQEFIGSHHGDSVIYYFYDKAQKLGLLEEVSKADYSYPGPRPVSREVSICMMADAVEAASRSLPSYDRKSLDDLVDGIIDSQISGGQFNNSRLTFEEISKVKFVLKNKLYGIYHGRIAYPKKK